jgi:hypothetical protein
MTEPETPETIGWGHLFRNINLHDFADMVRGEGMMIGTLTRRAFAALPRLPFGPFAFFAFFALACIRAFLLFMVVVFFGAAIVLISVLRGLTRRGAHEEPAEAPPSDDAR